MLAVLERSPVVDRARALLGTPFRHGGRTPGVGVDWLGVILIATENRLPSSFIYPIDDQKWMMKGEPFIEELNKLPNFSPIPFTHAGAGDVVCFRMELGSPVAHAGVLTRPGVFLHAPLAQSVRETRLDHPWWQRRLAFAYKVIS